MNEKTKTILQSAGWILFLMTLMFLFGLLYGSKVVSGLDWPLNKSDTCLMFNKTGYDCDAYWCVNILGKTWDANNTLCREVITINNTIVLNQTNQSVINQTIYVNQTIISNESINDTGLREYCRNYTDSNILILRNNLLDRIENKTIIPYQAETQAPTSPYLIIAIVVIVMAGLGFMSWNYTQQKKYPKAQDYKRDFTRNQVQK